MSNQSWDSFRQTWYIPDEGIESNSSKDVSNNKQPVDDKPKIEVSINPDVSISSVRVGDGPWRYILGQKALANLNGSIEVAQKVAEMHPKEFTPTLEYLRDAFGEWSSDGSQIDTDDQKLLLHQAEIAIAAVVIRSGNDVQRRVTSHQTEIFDEFMQARKKVNSIPNPDIAS